MTHIPRIPPPVGTLGNKKSLKLENNIVLSEMVSFLYCAQMYVPICGSKLCSYN